MTLLTINIVGIFKFSLELSESKKKKKFIGINTKHLISKLILLPFSGNSNFVLRSVEQALSFDAPNN